MKKILFISVSVSALILTAASFFMYSQKNSTNATTLQVVQTKNNARMCCAPGKNEAVSENSVFQLVSKWMTEDGKSILLSNLKGKKEIMAMIFTNCTYACPIIVNDMKKIESQIKRNDVSFVLISIDPLRDTPEALKKFAENNKLDLNKWKLLTGSENSVNELAAVLGFKYKKEADGSFSHSNIINVLNETGEVAYQHFGLNQDVQDVLNVINK